MERDSYHRVWDIFDKTYPKTHVVNIQLHKS